MSVSDDSVVSGKAARGQWTWVTYAKTVAGALLLGVGLVLFIGGGFFWASTGQAVSECANAVIGMVNHSCSGVTTFHDMAILAAGAGLALTVGGLIVIVKA